MNCQYCEITIQGKYNLNDSTFVQCCEKNQCIKEMKTDYAKNVNI